MRLVVLALTLGWVSACAKPQSGVITVFDSRGTELVRVRADGVIHDSHGTEVARLSQAGMLTVSAGGSPIEVQISAGVDIDGDTYHLRGMSAGDLTVAEDGVISTDGQTWGRVTGYAGASRRARLAAAFVVISLLPPPEPTSAEPTPVEPTPSAPPPPPPPLGAPK